MDANRELNALASTLTAEQLRLVTAIALEQVIPMNILSRIHPGAASFVAEGVRSGLLVAVTGTDVSVHPRYAELVLRAASERGELSDVADETHALLENRSVSHAALALHCGDLNEFLRRASLRRLPRAIAYSAAAEWLRRSVCSPFDAAWLTRTFGERAPEIAARVLRHSLEGPAPCTPLYEWALSKREAIDDDELDAALAEHSFLRGDSVLLDELATSRQGYRAAARFIDGDMGGAQRLIDHALGRSNKPPVERYGAVTSLLALLLLARDTDAARASAKRLVGAGSSDAERGTARAFRVLVRYLRQPTTESRRIDVHQLDPHAGAWELLLTAFTVLLHLDQPWTRASFAQVIARRALDWRAGDYAWLAKQALLLASALEPEYCARELSERSVDPATLRCRPRELSVWDVIAPKADWQKALDALARVADAVFEQGELTRRVAWFIDMTDGSFARPALQEHREDGGFSAGQRLSVGELYELRSELPPEDQRVLECTRPSRDGRRELTPDAHEMLIGHPRVFNGARGTAPVEVVRGSCRVETEEDGGHIHIVVEPAGATGPVTVVAESDTRLVVYRVSAVMQRVIAALPHGARIPRSREPELTRVLGRLAEAVEVRSAQLGAERTVEADSTPCVRIAQRAGAWLVQFGVRPFGSRGRFFVAGDGRAALTLHAPIGNQTTERLRCVRDLALERRRINSLVDECSMLRLNDDARDRDVADGFMVGEEGVLSLLSELRDAQTPHALEWPETTALRLRGKVTTKALHARLRSKKGWYLATGGLSLDDVTEVSLAEIVGAPALGNGRFIRLADGDYLELEARVRSMIAALAAAGKCGDGGVAVHRAAVAALAELTDETLARDPDVDGWLRRVADLARKEYAVPSLLRAELRPYQLEGFVWLSRLADLGVGACLADDMGLGKTLQIIALLLARASDGLSLVVAPTSVCGNWARELRRFAPSLSVVEYAGPARGDALANLVDAADDARAGVVLICSYAVLQQDAAELNAVHFSTAVLDEAQFIKNAESLRARAAFGLVADKRIAATGTPVENHYGDLWSIFHFLNPGLLGGFASFKRRFVNPKETGSSDGGDAPEAVLRRMIEPYVLRRRKGEVLRELPPITEVQHDVHLSEQDALRYAFLRKQIHEKLFTAHGKRHSKLEILAEISRLRRFCCHPRLVFADAQAESAKIDAFLDLVEELRENGHRALVFSQYVDFLALVREQLNERAIAHEYLDGSTRDRQARVDAFQRGDASLFLISLKAGGFGINLTAADDVIHLDPWWNPAVEAQATDRAHRIGQERPVTVYRLVTRNTIEEEIIKLHDKKGRLARVLLDEDAKYDTASPEDFAQLLEGSSPMVVER